MNNNLKTLKVLISFLIFIVVVAGIVYKFGMQGAVLIQNKADVKEINKIQIEQGKQIIALQTDVKHIKEDTTFIRNYLDEIRKKSN